MKIIRGIFIPLITSILLIILICTPPNNPFDNTDNVRLLIEVPKKPDGYNYCINDKVRFKVTVLFADLVEKISIHFDENGDKDEKELTRNTSKNEVIFFNYEYREKGLKNVKFTLTFRQSAAGRDTLFFIDIGVKPTILHGKDLIAGSNTIPGKPLTLTVDHEKFSEATYKWYRNSKLLPGQDQQSLIFNPLKETDEGQYYCIVITDWGKDQSKTFNLSFKNTLDLPKILKHPQSIQSTAGKNARFTIKATGGQLKYQWQKNEKNISGANDSLFEVKDLNIGDSATYRCIVSNKAGSDTSKNAILIHNSTMNDKKDPEIKDFSNPSITILWPNENFTITETRKPLFTWKVFDDKSGIDYSSIVLTVNGVEKKVTQSSNNGSYTPDYDSLPDGNYNLRLTVSDMAGNTSVASVHFSVNAKKMNPTITRDTITINDQIMIYANLSNEYPAVSGKNFNYKIFKVENSNQITIASLNDYGSLNWRENYGIGKYKVTITATDDSGSTVEDSLTYTVINDKPEILNLADSTIHHGVSIFCAPIVNEHNQDSLVYTWQLNAEILSTNKNFTINPDKNLIGMKCYVFSVTDEDGNRAVDTMRIFTVAGMRKIPGGSFLMGDSLGSIYESPSHQVTLENDFYIDTTEVTQMEYENILKVNPSTSKGLFKPVFNVSWGDAALFCNAKSKLHGLDTVYEYSTIFLGPPGQGCKLRDLVFKNDNNGYRLPTDAEWEYACRAGTTERYYWGSDTLGYTDYEWTKYNAKFIQPVAGKLPNPFGLYDMMGNANEWVHNWYYEYSKGNMSNPMGPKNGIFKVLRGSCIRYFLKVTTRSTVNEMPYDHSGFRIVLPKAPTN